RIDAGVAARAEHFDNDRLAGVLMRGKADHLDHNLVVRRGPFRAGVADGHRLREHLAIDFDIACSTALLIDADKLMRVALDDLDDLARLPKDTPFAAGLAATQAHADYI